MNICRVRSCSYHVFDEEEGEAYQHQCCNDEIEVDMNDSGVPQCYTYQQSNISDEADNDEINNERG